MTLLSRRAFTALCTTAAAGELVKPLHAALTSLVHDVGGTPDLTAYH